MDAGPSLSQAPVPMPMAVQRERIWDPISPSNGPLQPPNSLPTLTSILASQSNAVGKLTSSTSWEIIFPPGKTHQRRHISGGPCPKYPLAARGRSRRPQGPPGEGPVQPHGRQLRVPSGGQFKPNMVVLAAELSTNVPNGPI